MTVPPVPTPATKMSTLPSVSAQISSAVVRRWTSGLASLANCWAQMEFSVLADDLLGLLHGAAHALGAGGQDDLGAVRAQHDPAFGGHGFRHGQDDLVAAGRAHHGQGDSGVAGRAFDDGAAGLEGTGLLGSVDDGDADPVLDAVGRVVELQLDGHGGVKAFGQPVQPDQRSSAHQLGYIVIDRCHVCMPVFEEG